MRSCDPGPPADPASPGWDFDRDPVEVGSVVLRGDVATMRPETSILFGSTPKIYRFELFRDRLRWHYVRGVEDFLMTAECLAQGRLSPMRIALCAPGPGARRLLAGRWAERRR